MRAVAIMGGGDWADASVHCIDVPKDLDLKQAKAEYECWYREVYLPKRLVTYSTFAAWLIANKGCRDSTLIEEFWEE